MDKPVFVQYNDHLGKDILYRPSQPVANIHAPEIQQFIDTMYEKMAGSGIGLAANQVGKPLQIFMIQFSPSPDDPRGSSRYRLDMPEVPYQVFINPRIVRASEETVSFWHGCLSAQDRQRGKVATYQWIEYEAYNRHGEKIVGRLGEMGAVIFQHEFRHLLGRLYIDQTTIFMDFDELNAKFQSGELRSYELCGSEVPHLLSDYKVGESIKSYSKRLYSNR